jgi:hypothetical protein
MLSKCANSECLTSFGDYRRGRLFRFHQSHPKGSALVNSHSVTHFWLCSLCPDIYTLEYREGRAVLVSRQHIILPRSASAALDDRCVKSSQPDALDAVR